MKEQTTIEKTRHFVQEQLQNDYTGHDWYHIERVTRLAQYIANQEKVDVFTVTLIALLHDIKDHKFTGGDSQVGANIAYDFLMSLDVQQEIANEVRHTIAHMSYKGGLNRDKKLSLAGQVVQDADRLDAIGAIGIARAFTYGGNKNRVNGSVAHMYNEWAIVSFTGLSEEETLETLLMADIDIVDVEAEEDGTITVYGQPQDLYQIKTTLEETSSDVHIDVEEITMIPMNYVTLEGDDLKNFEKLLSMLDAVDDVDTVYHNVTLNEEE